MEESFGWGQWVSKVTAIPVCVRLHGPWFLNGSVLGVPDDNKFRERVYEEGRAIRTAAAVTAPSRDVLEQVRGFYGLALPEAEVIPNPIWPVPVAERWRLEGCDPNQVLFIGRFDRHKGGDLIIEAFGRVLHDVPEASFVSWDRTGAAPSAMAGTGVSKPSSGIESLVLSRPVASNGSGSSPPGRWRNSVAGPWSASSARVMKLSP